MEQHQMVLVINAGSSSIKFAVYPGAGSPVVGSITFEKDNGNEWATRAQATEGDITVIDRSWEREDAQTRDGALSCVLDELERFGRVRAAGHRVVHGGMHFLNPARITDEVEQAISELCQLAPLHNPIALGPIRLLRERMPDVPQYAVFDTAFHATQPSINHVYGLPDEPRFAHIMRYGFHGTNYEWVSTVLPRYITARVNDFVIVDHAGSGHSMCLLWYTGDRWVSYYCTLGFGTSGFGPMHATRPGDLDADVALELVKVCGGVEAAQRVILKQSGLLGLSALSDELKVVAEHAFDPHQPDENCRAAVAHYVERSIETLGRLAAKAYAHGRLRGVVWTGGAGERAGWYRKATARAIPGLILRKNQADIREGVISTGKSRVLGLVVPANEEEMIRRHVERLMAA